MELILYGNRESGHSYKVRLMLALTQTPHEYRPIDIEQPREQRPEEFRQASKYGEVPVLVDRGQPYVQSNAILLHHGAGPELRQEVPRQALGDIEPEVGMLLALNHPMAPQPIPVKIVAVTPETVTIDLNHPLAGERLDLLLHPGGRRGDHTTSRETSREWAECVSAPTEMRSTPVVLRTRWGVER